MLKLAPVIGENGEQAQWPVGPLDGYAQSTHHAAVRQRPVNVTAGVGPQIRDHDGFSGLQRLVQEGGSLAGRCKQRAHIALPTGGGEQD
jgi:hypothetical protein